MNKIITNILLVPFLSFTCINFSFADSAETQQIEGINDAKKSESSVHADYLQCYALKESDKANCHKRIVNNKKVFNEKLLSSNIYLTSFSYEAERLGFLWFLQNNNLACDAIDEGPLYQSNHNAYEVLCRNGNKYYMQFDYEKNLWNLKSD